MEEEILEEEIQVQEENYIVNADLSDYYTKEETNNLLSNKQNTLTFDNTPTLNSNNPVTSDGIAQALASASGGFDVIKMNYSDSSTVIKEKMKDFYDTYKDNDSMCFFFLTDSEQTENDNIVMMLSNYNVSNGTGYFKFEGRVIPYYENITGTYGITYRPVYRYYLLANISNEEITNYSLSKNVISYENVYESDVLGVYNTTYFEPYDNYQPATKKYVDDIVGNINTVLATLTTPQEDN